MMFYLGPHIFAIPGTLDLLASPQVDENGRHNVLVEKATFKSVRTTITNNLESWIDIHVSSDARPLDEQFAGSARVKPIYDDGQLSGENSWMSASNVSFMSMDLSTVRDQVYFDDSTNIEKVFTYADITMPNRSAFSNKATEATDDITTDVTSEMTEMETRQKQELEKLAEVHRLATEKSNKLVEAQRLEIEELKAQRQADLETRAHEQQMAEEKVKAQDNATSELRKETKAELNDLKLQMVEMMVTFKAAFSTKIENLTFDNKRSAPTDDDTNNDDNSQSDEKRRDVRSTPGKKLFHDKMDLEDPALSQQKLNDAPSPTMK
jgi:hypothetical protein